MDSSFFRKGAGRTACALALSSTMVLPLLPAQAADAPTPATSPSSLTTEATPIASEQVTPLATEPVDSIPAMKDSPAIDTPADAEQPTIGEPAANTEQPATHSIELDADGIDMSQPTVTLKGDYISSETSEAIPYRISLVRADSLGSGVTITTPYSYAGTYFGLYGYTDNVTLVEGLYHHAFELSVDTSILDATASYRLIIEFVGGHEESTLIHSSPIELKNTNKSTVVSLGNQKLNTGTGSSAITANLQNYAQYGHVQVEAELIRYDLAYDLAYPGASAEPTIISKSSGYADDAQLTLNYNTYDILYSKAYYVRVIVRNEQGNIIDIRSQHTALASPELKSSITKFSNSENGNLELTVHIEGMEGYRENSFVGYTGGIKSKSRIHDADFIYLAFPVTKNDDGTVDLKISKPSALFESDDFYTLHFSAYTTYMSRPVASGEVSFTTAGSAQKRDAHRVTLESSQIDMSQPTVTLTGTYREDPHRNDHASKVVLYDVDEFAAIEYGAPRAYAEGTFTRIEENSQLGDLYSFSIEVDTSTVDPSKNYNVGFLVYEGHGYTAMYGYAPVELVNVPAQPVTPEPQPEPKPEKQEPKLTAESTHLQQYGYNTFAFELANAADYREGANFVKFQLIGTAEDGSERTFLSDGLTLPELDSDGLATAVYHFENSDLVPGYSYHLQVQWVHGGYHSEPLASESFDLVAPESQAYATELAWAQKHQVIPVHDRVLDPKVNVSTADMALALYRASGSPEVQLPAASPYLDVSADDSEQYRAIVWASQQRLVDAPNGRFYPARAVSRATLAAALYRLDHEVKQPDNSERGYFGTEISWAFDQNLVPLQMSMTEREFGPRLALTRADLAGFLYRWNALHPVFVD